jgi:hypothetical protein
MILTELQKHAMAVVTLDNILTHCVDDDAAYDVVYKAYVKAMEAARVYVYSADWKFTTYTEAIQRYTKDSSESKMYIRAMFS